MEEVDFSNPKVLYELTQSMRKVIAENEKEWARISEEFLDIMTDMTIMRLKAFMKVAKRKELDFHNVLLESLGLINILKRMLSNERFALHLIDATIARLMKENVKIGKHYSV